MNRLALETSPYLLQHKDNPVDWYPWGPEALARAQAEDKPILLSVGYSTCHWCHVMAHESFEDPELAARLNALFVNVKVDREERPDLDQIYQTAQQMLSGRSGGWPLTLFLAPDQTPFFGGTYFPREARFGLPGFARLIESVAYAWANRRGEIVEQNASLRAALAGVAPAAAEELTRERAPIERALAANVANFDDANGGYGGAPKFPRPADLEFLLAQGDAAARGQVLFSLRKMAEGGLFDQLGGGFYRYSVDAMWMIPHFEKMLYDNGPLLGLYADAWALTGEPLFEQAAAMTAAWLEREMTSPDGLFHSAQDADSEHEEGKFYVWRPDQARALLSPDEYAVAARHWGLDRPANFEGQAWHLRVAKPLAEVAGRLGIAEAEAARHLAGARAKLFAARGRRIPPGRDDKVLTGWNALMVRGLARAARRFGRADWLAAAWRALDALRNRLWRDGRLLASYKDGQANLNAYLDDHAYLLAALLETMQAGYRGVDMAWARALADALLVDFEDTAAGGFYFTRHDHEALIQRPKPAYDQATPSGNGMAALSLGRLGLLTGDARYGAAAERCLRLFQAAMRDQPLAHGTLLTALAETLQPPRLIVLRGPRDEVAAWQAVANPRCPPGTLLLAPADDCRGLPEPLAKPVRAGVAAYVCEGANCLPEIVQMTELTAILSGYAMN
ncbi:thioredoxin domain-containing protein [Parasulfuritortus cantonensis]|uniref:Thioredoxin domain-containing protein n=1 Tax=Parasulfuritortus cantonensis TaxID=2528202 RepID=A0A4R1B442_9PROT|nr:thioredoxin domain-containing protein [Parasulfuritortus cantonensis]TCJ12852.1 thioredoxin domain-containing protein [Parasulfuritortus cantonensis]